jgi:hypothetical protein
LRKGCAKPLLQPLHGAHFNLDSFPVVHARRSQPAASSVNDNQDSFVHTISHKSRDDETKEWQTSLARTSRDWLLFVLLFIVYYRAVQRQQTAQDSKDKRQRNRHRTVSGFLDVKKAGCVVLMALLLVVVVTMALKPLGALNRLLGSSQIDTTPELVKTYLQQQNFVGLSLDTDSLDAGGSYQKNGGTDDL